MERRAVALITVLLVTVAAGCGGEPERLDTGGLVPAAWRTGPSDPRPSVIWVFRTEDCLSCEALDYSLRRLQRAHAGTVALVAVHVGAPEHASIAQAFFASRRLALDRMGEISPREFRGRYGDLTLPLLLLARGDTIIWSSASPGQPRLTVEGIDSLFNSRLTDERDLRRQGTRTPRPANLLEAP